MSGSRQDSFVITARREALVVAAAFIVALVWTVGYCLTHGYGRDPREIALVFGVPDWIFWGVLTPWGASYLFSSWFCVFYMKDADLGAEASDENEDASHAKYTLIRKSCDFCSQMRHHVQRVGHHNHKAIGRVLFNIFTNFGDNFSVYGQ